jgi:hypothetical protein
LPGPTGSIRYTRSGPYDERLGYSRIPEFIERTGSLGYEIAAQARASKTYVALSDLGISPIFPEKYSADLEILDRDGNSLFEFRNPQNSYGAYPEIPPIIVKTLLFIENHSLLDSRFPHRNPVVEWQRFSHAVFDYGVHAINRGHPMIGASTLATQLEKMRHSPGGRTRSASETARQMFSASLRAYQDGPHTLAAQQRLICDYLNSLPLAAAAGHGEVIGLADGLEIWYEADFQSTNLLLYKSETDLNYTERREQARRYREVLSLLLATRAPSRYLVDDPGALQTDNYSQPLNINEGTKLELGSTAKLRTLVNYLEIVEQLHKHYADVPAQTLNTFTPLPEDRLTSWAIHYLSTAREKNLKPMLEAALDRQYSARPVEGFFTAGGLHHFSNFESSDDHHHVTVREAFERSVNLVFIRDWIRKWDRFWQRRRGRFRTGTGCRPGMGRRN